MRSDTLVLEAECYPIIAETALLFCFGTHRSSNPLSTASPGCQVPGLSQTSNPIWSLVFVYCQSLSYSREV